MNIMLKMTGSELFEFYSSKMDEYSQDLGTAFIHIGEDLFPMLEECEKTGKKIVLVDDPELEGADDQPFSVQIA